MSNTSLVLTVLGPDRPGIVEEIAELVAAHGGNWVESRMAHLAGKFAGILRVEVAAEAAADLTDALAKLNAKGLESIVHADPAAAAAGTGPVVQLDLIGHDQPGIVRQITRVLAAHGVNVEELETECLPAANTGQPLFKAVAQLRLPAGLSRDDLRAALEEVAADLVVDVTLQS
ncbi:MAG: glycine cleavage system protein R [Planctomycetaceae bacterium]|nr:glycine cleavage system protein R [Planctomycetaceae bacterium]